MYYKEFIIKTFAYFQNNNFFFFMNDDRWSFDTFPAKSKFGGKQ